MLLLAVAVVTAIAAVFLRHTRSASRALMASRCAYLALLVQALSYFPAQSGFRIATPVCEWTFGFALAVHSLQNYPHIILFALFFLLTYAQLPNVRRALLWSAAACLAMGFFVELAQGATRAGHCRMRDLIPDGVGALFGAAIVVAARKIRSSRRVVQRALLLIAACGLFHCADRVPDRPMNFGIVEPGMYRGGRPSANEIVTLRRDLGVRTMIRLSRGDAAAERAAARLARITLIEIPLDPKLVGTNDAKTRAAVERAYRAFTDRKNAPVYVYCDHGRDRTGFVVALYRTRIEKWPHAKVVEELARHGHGIVMRRYLPDITRALAREHDATRRIDGTTTRSRTPGADVARRDALDPLLRAPRIRAGGEGHRRCAQVCVGAAGWRGVALSVA
jgi:hypothetical protein